MWLLQSPQAWNDSSWQDHRLWTTREISLAIFSYPFFQKGKARLLSALDYHIKRQISFTFFILQHTIQAKNLFSTYTYTHTHTDIHNTEMHTHTKTRVHNDTHVHIYNIHREMHTYRDTYTWTQSQICTHTSPPVSQHHLHSTIPKQCPPSFYPQVYTFHCQLLLSASFSRMFYFPLRIQIISRLCLCSSWDIFTHLVFSFNLCPGLWVPLGQS